MNARWILAALALASAGCMAHANAGSGVGKDANGALRFALPQLPDKAPHDIVSDRGSVVIVDVWASWCEPCRRLLPTYKGLAARYRGKDVRIYALNADDDPRGVPTFLSEIDFNLPVLLDPAGDVVDGLLKVRVLPTVFVLDRQGRVRHMHEGVTGDPVAELAAEIDQLLSEPQGG